MLIQSSYWPKFWLILRNNWALSSNYPSLFGGGFVWVVCLDEVYIDGPCSSNTLASVCLCVLKEWVTWLTFIYKTNRIRAVWLGSWISQLNFCSMVGPVNFLITKNVRLTIYVSISLQATHMVDLCILYLRFKSHMVHLCILHLR